VSGEKHLEGCIYHMVHFDNLQSIFQRRAILSKESVIQEVIEYQSIAYEEVQSLRDRIFVWDASKQTFRGLHSYVPFYFSTLTPMLFVQYKNDIQDEIVIFEVSRSILRNQGVLFTDGNASNQQLSKYRHEVVRIMPATLARDDCRRRYHPDGPYGANASCTDFYSHVTFLERLNWEVINNRWFTDEEKKRIKHAEVLIPDIFPLGKVQNILVRNRDMEKRVNDLISACGLSGRIPWAICRPNLYFQ
jgi:aromatic ring-opening dioxygenase LigB subunit